MIFGVNCTLSVEELPPMSFHNKPLVPDTCHLKFFANAVSVAAFGVATFRSKLSFPPAVPLQKT